MKGQNKDHLNELLHRFLDGDLQPEEERDALILIAEDDEMRERLRFDRRISSILSNNFDAETYAVPDGFTDDVMSEIVQLEKQQAPKQTWLDSVKQQLEALFTPREFSFSPATIFAVPALVLITIAGLYQTESFHIGETAEYTAGTQIVSGEHSEEIWIRFVYIDDEASQVAVAGNFSDWEPVELDSREMDGKTVWTGLVPVERGEHRYMFVRNGEEWISDPLAEIQRDDGFGNKNAVIYL